MEHELPFIGCMLVVVGFLQVFTLLRELIKTLRRIEARLTLQNPLESEEKLLRNDLLLRGELEDRAIQYDIWFHKTTKKLHGLQGNDYKEARELQKYTEKTRRN